MHLNTVPFIVGSFDQHYDKSRH